MTLSEYIQIRTDKQRRFKLEWLAGELPMSRLIRRLIDEAYEKADGPPLPPELTDESENNDDEFPI